jgi:hypothetical protein
MQPSTDRAVFVLDGTIIIWVANSTGEKCMRHCMTYSRGWDSVTTAPAVSGVSSQQVQHRRSGSNQEKYVPEAPRFLHHFYFLCVTLNADK